MLQSRMLGLLLVLVVAACAGESDQGSSEGATTIPPTTTTVAPTTTTVSAEKLAKGEEVGDVAAGEELFFHRYGRDSPRLFMRNLP